MKKTADRRERQDARHQTIIRTEVSKPSDAHDHSIPERVSFSKRVQERLERQSNALIHEYVGRSRNTVYSKQLVRTGLPLLLGDLATIGACYLGGTVLADAILTGGASSVAIGIYVGLASLLLLFFLAAGFSANVGLHPIFELKKSSVPTTLVFVLTVGVIAVQAGALAASLIFPLMLFAIPVFRTILRRWLVTRPWWGIRCLVFGCDRRLAGLLKGHMNNAVNGLKPVGFLQNELPPDCHPDLASLYLGGDSDASAAALTNGAFCAIVHRRGRTDQEIMGFVDQFLGLFSRIIIVPDDHRLPSLWVLVRSGTMTLGEQLMKPSAQFLKRGVDVVLSLTLAILFSPLVILTAIAIRWTTGHRAFVFKRRVGKFGHPFQACFFRTTDPRREAEFRQMLINDPEARRQWEDTRQLNHDPRQTRLGYWLRRTRFYAFPMLWNVLRGEMSLIGPKPSRISVSYSPTQPFSARDRVAPGIIGFWSISDQYFEPLDRRTELDAFYVKHWSMWFDIFIAIYWMRRLFGRKSF